MDKVKYSNLSLRDFLEMQGVNKDILNNPAFDTIMYDSPIKNWNELREKECFESVNNNGYKELLFKDNSNSYNITISPHGENIIIYFTGEELRDNGSKKYIANTRYNISFDNEEIHTSEHISSKLVNNQSTTQEVLEKSPERKTDKDYLKNGILSTEWEYVADTINPVVNNKNIDTTNFSHIIGIKSKKIVRRELSYANIARLHYENYENGDKADGYYTIDSRNPIKLNCSGINSTDARSIINLAKNNSILIYGLDKKEKEAFLKNAPEELQDYFIERLNNDYNSLIFEPFQISTGDNLNKLGETSFHR
jgi:hypothetical protein